MKFPTCILPALLFSTISQLAGTVEAVPFPATADSVIGCDLIIVGPPVTVRSLSICMTNHLPSVTDTHISQRLVLPIRVLLAFNCPTTVRFLSPSSHSLFTG